MKRASHNAPLSSPVPCPARRWRTCVGTCTPWGGSCPFCTADTPRAPWSWNWETGWITAGTSPALQPPVNHPALLVLPRPPASCQSPSPACAAPPSSLLSITQPCLCCPALQPPVNHPALLVLPRPPASCQSLSPACAAPPSSLLSITLTQPCLCCPSLQPPVNHPHPALLVLPHPPSSCQSPSPSPACAAPPSSLLSITHTWPCLCCPSLQPPVNHPLSPACVAPPSSLLSITHTQPCLCCPSLQPPVNHPHSALLVLPLPPTSCQSPSLGPACAAPPSSLLSITHTRPCLCCPSLQPPVNHPTQPCLCCPHRNIKYKLIYEYRSLAAFMFFY